ncbi:MAG TPA: rhomboid family intramembrane serine protease [Gemmatimonadaceae bacterium]|nr:rhomboid family intramembrane serine protease [Gemmatimonadaceae bacterium]
MIPIGDENPTFRQPLVTWLLLGLIFATWVLVQGAGFDEYRLAASACNLGMVPAELTKSLPVGYGVPMGRGLACVIDADPINKWTPFTSMFLHGSWAHLIGNSLFLWVFGNNVEDSMGRLRFLVFYLVCGLAAAGAHVMVDPRSPLPTVGASGAISGIMGAYLVLYPRVKVKMLFWFLLFIRVFRVPAWLVLIWWFALQVLEGLPQLRPVETLRGGTAVWAHVGGFVAGVLLVKLFENRELVRRHLAVADARGVWER